MHDFSQLKCPPEGVVWSAAFPSRLGTEMSGGGPPRRRVVNWQDGFQDEEAAIRAAIARSLAEATFDDVDDDDDEDDDDDDHPDSDEVLRMQIARSLGLTKVHSMSCTCSLSLFAHQFNMKTHVLYAPSAQLNMHFKPRTHEKVQRGIERVVHSSCSPQRLAHRLALLRIPRSHHRT